MKRYAMECIGTFFLTVAISLMVNPVAIGLMLMAMIYVGGHISGAHFNPAISFACFIQNRLKYAEMGMYVAAQSVGALIGLCFFSLLTNSNFTVDIVPGTPLIGSMVIEALFVLVFAWVYLAMNLTDRYKGTAIPGIVLGLTLCNIASVGGLFNPAVAVASMVCNLPKDGMIGGMDMVLIHIVGPLVGAFGASLVFDYFKSEA